MSRNPFIHIKAPPRAGIVTVSGSETAHLRNVLRASVGCRFTAFDGHGNSWLAEIKTLDGNGIQAAVIRELPLEPTPPVHLTLALGIIKGKRMDWAVEKVAEIGVATVIPLITRRGVVRPDGGKVDCWRAIALAAAKQSRRTRLMSVDMPCPLL